MEEKGMEDKVQALAPRGELSCAAALELARREGVAPAAVGAAADRLGVRIRHCQLGCFDKKGRARG